MKPPQLVNHGIHRGKQGKRMNTNLNELLQVELTYVVFLRGYLTKLLVRLWKFSVS